MNTPITSPQNLLNFVFCVQLAIGSWSLADDTPRETAELVEHHELERGQAVQGLALTEEFYFSANSKSIFRFDKNWKMLNEQRVEIEGVNHIGAIHHHDGHVWAGMLNGPVGDFYDEKLNRGIIAKIRGSDLKVVRTWDITEDLTWIDPVYFDGTHLWVGDLSDLGIHQYQLTDKQLVRTGTFRYPSAMHFSQGIRIVGNKLYTIHTFGNMDGLFEFQLPEKLTEAVNQPIRAWNIQETNMHLEGFDFIPDKPNEIWTAQGSHVDHYVLDGISVE